MGSNIWPQTAQNDWRDVKLQCVRNCHVFLCSDMYRRRRSPSSEPDSKSENQTNELCEYPDIKHDAESQACQTLKTRNEQPVAGIYAEFTGTERQKNEENEEYQHQNYKPDDDNAAYLQPDQKNKENEDYQHPNIKPDDDDDAYLQPYQYPR